MGDLQFSVSEAHPPQAEISNLRFALVRICLLLFFFVLIGCKLEKKVLSNFFSDNSLSGRREMIGERLYQRYCSGCHGTTGEGDGLHSYTLNPPPANHADTAYMNSLSDEYLFEIISNGGAHVGKSTEMPRWKDVLGRNDINNVIIYLRKFPHDGNSSE